MLSCSACAGFVPHDLEACPNCGEPRAPRPSSSALGKLAKLAAVAGTMATLMACYGAPYEPPEPCFSNADCYGGQVCQSNYCVYAQAEYCGNGIDDDLDGLIDGADPDCGSEVVELVCDDGLDDDADGLVDCEDSDCDFAPACVEDCSNGIDDDDDGLIDCQDSGCPACPLVETSCGNLFDDDGDGLADCDDPDCAAQCTPPVCGDGILAGVEECDDANLDDGDGCSGSCLVETDVLCASIPILALGSNAGTTAGGTSAFEGSCVPAGGLETSYLFTAAADGTLNLTLQSASTAGIYVLGTCADDAVELACANDPDAATPDVVSVDMLAEQTVWIVIDESTTSPGGPFTVDASFVQQ